MREIDARFIRFCKRMGAWFVRFIIISGDFEKRSRGFSVLKKNGLINPTFIVKPKNTLHRNDYTYIHPSFPNFIFPIAIRT